ncbi:unnamed protein product, partial [Choristocarpus tenellus]
MAAFGLVDAPLLPSVDAFINPEKDDESRIQSLNAVVLNIHRDGKGAFEGLVSTHMGDYITNEDPKAR